MELHCHLRFSWERGESLKCFSHSCSGLQKWAFAGASSSSQWETAALHLAKEPVLQRQPQLWWFPAPARGRWDWEGPRAWKRGRLELNLAVLHFPREQDEERQFLCCPSSMINGEFKHSIGLLCSLPHILSGKVCFSPKKRVAEFFQRHHLKWLEASQFEFVG